MNYLETVKILEQEKEMQKLYKASIEKFSENWLAGTYDRLDRENPGLTSQIDAARDTLDDVWIAVRHGKARMPEFRKVLQEWEILHKQAIELARHGRRSENVGKEP